MYAIYVLYIVLNTKKKTGHYSKFHVLHTCMDNLYRKENDIRQFQCDGLIKGIISNIYI